ncbi:hypothetical protein V5O48_019580, partial [Marasmius crinis-equi]
TLNVALDDLKGDASRSKKAAFEVEAPCEVVEETGKPHEADGKIASLTSNEVKDPPDDDLAAYAEAWADDADLSDDLK